MHAFHFSHNKNSLHAFNYNWNLTLTEKAALVPGGVTVLVILIPVIGIKQFKNMKFEMMFEL